MGFIGSLLSDGKGSGFQAGGNGPETPVQNGATTDQATQLYGQTQNGLTQQQNFLNLLSQQGGLANQSNVFSQQQGLANQLQQQANGAGPNPVQAMLAQNTAANTANQAALMAGQRGVGGNAGLMARQAAMNGANNQQQMVGQAATLGAQQQLAAQQALMQQQQNLAGMATQQVGQQANALTGLNQATQSAQGNILGALGNQNSANVSLQNGKNSANAGMAGINAQGQQAIFGGLLGGAGSAMSNMKAHGGMITAPQQFADGGAVQLGAVPMPSLAAPVGNGPQSFAGNFLSGYGPSAVGSVQPPTQASAAPMTGSSALQKGSSDAMSGLIKAAPALLAASQGAVVPGQASVKGDSYKNDTVPAILSPGEVVIPRHVMQSKNPAEQAKKFVAAIMAKQGMQK
jgi:hypothetical protein